MHRVLGIIAIVPTTVLLTISFFVLFAREKVKDVSLKTFGLVVAVLLWVAAAIIFSAGIFTLTCGGNGFCGRLGMEKMHMLQHGYAGPCPEMSGRPDRPWPPQAGPAGKPEPPKALKAEEKK